MNKTALSGLFIILLCMNQPSILAQNYLPFENNGKWGLNAPSENIILEAEWMMVFPDFQGNFYALYEDFNSRRFTFIRNGTKTGSWKYYARKQLISDHVLALKEGDMETRYQMYDLLSGRKIGGKYYNVEPYSEGLAAVNISDWREVRFSYINKEGRIVIDGKYKDARPFSEGFAAVRNVDEMYYGYINRRGDMVIPEMYGNAGDFRNGYAIADRSFEDVGLIGKSNEVLLPFEFDELQRLDENLILTRKGHKYGLFDPQGRKTIIPCEYSYPQKFEKNYWLVSNGYNKGLFSSSGEKILPCSFDRINLRRADEVFLVEKRGKQGCYEWNGREILASNYDSIYHFENGQALVTVNGNFGMANRRGKLLVPPEYEAVYPGTNGFFAVKSQGRYGFVKDGVLFIPFNYDGFHGISDGLAVVAYKGLWGCVNSQGRETIPFQYEDMQAFSGGKAAVKKNGQWGFIDTEGSTLVNFRYDQVHSFRKNKTFVRRGSNWFVLDVSGREESVAYTEIIPFDSEGFIVAQQGRYGFVDKNFREVLPSRYSDIYPFTNELLKIIREGKTGLYNFLSDEVIEPRYTLIYPMKDGLIKVKMEESTGYLNSKGQELIMLPYADINHNDIKRLFSGHNGIRGLIRIVKDHKQGCIDQNAKPVVPARYDDIRLTGFNNMIIVNKNGRYGMYDQYGYKVLPEVFDNLHYDAKNDLLQANYRNVKIEMQGKNIRFDIKINEDIDWK